MTAATATQAESERIHALHERVDALNCAAAEAIAFDSARALELGEEASQLALETSYRHGLACALLNMGKAAQRLARLEGAVRYLIDAIQNFDELNNLLGKMDGFLHLGHCYKDLGRLQDAARAYEDALEINNGTEYLRERAGILNGIADVCRIRADYEKSVFYLKQSLIVHRETRDKIGEARCLNNTGILLTRLANYPDALENLLQSYELTQKYVNDNRAEANCLINIGVVYEELQDNHNALKYYSQALEVGRVAGDPMVEAIATINVGLVRRALGERETALRLFHAAVMLSHRIGFRQGEVAALGGLGRVQGELGAYQAARNAHEASLVIAREIGDREQEIESLVNIGRLRLAALEPALALEPLEAALALALEADRKQSLCDCHESLSVAFEHLGDLARALEHSRAFHRADREVRSEEADRKTRNQTARLELGQAKAEAEILRLRNEAAEGAREAAERANRAKSEFLSRMSHELRTPLNAILGFAQLLSHTSLEPKHQRSVDRIHRAGQYLLRLVDEVLDISRIEAGRLTTILEPVSLRAAVEDALELVGPLAVKRRIRLEGIVGGEWVALTDRHRLDQVLLNLLSNAVKYNREGGQVRVRCAAAAPGGLRIWIEDTGPGMTEEQIGRLFTPFERLGAEGGHVEGFGLGLTITKRITEAIGGRIGVQSVAGEGSAFWVELPLSDTRLAVQPEVTVDAPLEPIRSGASDAAPDPRLALPDPATGADADAPAVVLCLGLDATSQRLIRLVLAGRPDTTVLIAPEVSGLSARPRPDLIFLGDEFGGGGADGARCFEGLRALQSSLELRAVPAVVLVPEADVPGAARFLQAGAVAFIPKPFDVQAILGAVHSAVHRAVRRDA